ncbi:MAG: SPOR domain-containing protein [Gammaproteobacteria bacterium]|nr:SPOR domain-containing protein [Gammaproteobacteria bacterium]
MERAVLPMARAALDAGQVETARRLYRRVLQVDSDSADARMGLGDAAVASRESAEAARWYLAALANAKRPEERHAALLAHGRAALSAGQLEAARKSFARLTGPDEGAPQSVVAWGYNGLGLTLLLAGDVRGAVAAMEQAVLRTPDDARFQGNLTRALAMLTEFDDPSTDASPTDAIARARAPMLPVEALPADVEPAPPPSRSPPSRAPEPPALPEPVADDGAFGRERVASSPPETPTPVSVAGDPPAPEAAVAGDRVEAEPLIRTLPEPPPPLEQAATADALDPEREPPPTVPDAPTATVAGDRSEAEPPARTLPEPPPPLEQAATADALDPEREPPPTVPDAPTTAEPGEFARAPSIQLPATDADLVGTSEEQPLVLQEDAWTFVQPAAYASRTWAERLSERLRELTDHPVWVSEHRTSGEETLSRVRVGPIPSRDALVALGATLEAEGFAALSLPDAETGPGAAAGAPPLLVTEDGERYVQAGAYAVKAAAEELAARLAKLTRYRTGVSKAALPGGQRVYRVRIGPVEPGPELDDLADALEDHGYGRMATPPEPQAQPRPPAQEDTSPIVVRQAGQRFVQTAAYASAEAAEEAADRVRVLVDQPVQLDEARPGGDRTMYRVRIGPVRSYEELVTVADALEVAGYGVMTVLPDGADPVAGPVPATDLGLRPPPLVLHEDGERFLQAGAYAVRATAEALATQLRDRLLPPVSVTETVHADGRAMYRVRVGPIGAETPISSLVEAIEAVGRIAD